MKKTGLLIVFVFCIAAAIAQTPKLFITDSSLTVKQQQLLFQNRIIGKTSKGIIYALPQDGMPCLVADSSLVGKMPNALRKSQPGNNMPNPFYPQWPRINDLQAKPQTTKPD